MYQCCCVRACSVYYISDTFGTMYKLQLQNMNEVLAYVFHYIHCTSVDSISKVLLQYYMSDVQHHYQRIKIYKKGRTAFEADIFDIVINAKKRDQELQNLLIFGAHDVDCIHTFGPEELDIINLVERINDAEHKRNHVEGVLLMSKSNFAESTAERARIDHST